MSLRQIIIGILFAVTLSGGGVSAFAQVAITETQKLHFGKWFFGSDTSPVTISVNTSGVTNVSSPDVAMFTAPRPGIYAVTGLPAFAMINSVSVTMNMPLELGGRTFTIQNFTTAIPDADDLGRTTLRVGAEIVSAGGGLGYPGGVYDGTIDIEIDY